MYKNYNRRKTDDHCLLIHWLIYNHNAKPSIKFDKNESSFTCIIQELHQTPATRKKNALNLTKPTNKCGHKIHLCLLIILTLGTFRSHYISEEGPLILKLFKDTRDPSISSCRPFLSRIIPTLQYTIIV